MFAFVLKAFVAALLAFLGLACAVVPTHELSVHWEPIGQAPASAQDVDNSAADLGLEPTPREPTS